MRSNPPPLHVTHPGFWRVHPGMRIEPGDRWLDARGLEHPLPSEDVGRPVQNRQVVLRAERRRYSR